jgi:biotin transport system substrate-specific component
MGLLSRLGKSRWYFNMLAGIAGMAIVYLFGVARLKAVLHVDWAKALATGLIPFIPGDIAKIAVAGILAPPILKALSQIEQQSTNA